MKVTRAYEKDEQLPAPLLDVKLYDPTKREGLALAPKIDTGFSGSLLIPLDEYLKLGLQRYEEPQKAVTGRLATGLQVPLRASKGVVEVGTNRIRCPVYTTPLLLRPLLGRELLNLWRVLLDGPKKMVEAEL